jgi:hypothetical protein
MNKQVISCVRGYKSNFASASKEERSGKPSVHVLFAVVEFHGRI